jgi:IS30 family transposase
VSRLLFAQIIPSLKAKHTSLAQLCIFNGIPRQARKSTTLDNGSENYQHASLQEELAMQTYFADPYSAWQRGSNEYTNSLVAGLAVSAYVRMLKSNASNSPSCYRLLLSNGTWYLP